MTRWIPLWEKKRKRKKTGIRAKIRYDAVIGTFWSGFIITIINMFIC